MNINTDFTDIQQIYESKLGFTRIFKAKMKGKWHILKALKPEYADDPVAIKLLQREFEAGFPLSHPNIVQTINFENVEGVGSCIIMEYIDGCSLQDLIDKKRLTRDLIYHITSQLCAALIYLHEQKIIHRDLKPGNIMITTNGGNVKLIDFGYSNEENYAVLKHRAGTRKYAAPEHLADDGIIDARTDIYSLGVILREMNETLTIPSFWLRRISLHCRRIKKEKRYASASDVLKALESRTPRNLTVAGCFVALIILSISLASHFNVLGINAYLPWTPKITYVHDTLIQVKTDTIKQLADSIQANPMTKETGDSYRRLSVLLKHSKDLTIRMLEENETLQRDLTVPLSRRKEADDNLFFKVEDAVKVEVNKTIQPDDPQYSIFLSAALGIMERTFKEYNQKQAQ